MVLGSDLDTANETNWAEIFGSVAGAWQQQQLFDLNIERAKRGLAPISSAQFAPTYNVGVSPQLQQILLFGGIALLAVLMLRRR